MAPEQSQVFHLTPEHDRQRLSAALKAVLPGQSWSQIRKLLAGRRVQINGNLCLDEGRRVQAGDVLKIASRSLAPPVKAGDVKLVYLDEHVVVVNKPAGVTTLRHREEADLPVRRKQLQPTLDELVVRVVADFLGISQAPAPAGRAAPRSRRQRPDRRLEIRAVHRLDRDTSGLMLFARHAAAEQKLIRMFARHEVQRAYVAVVHGNCDERTIESWLVRDRGDGLRGSTPLGEAAEGAQRAITHVRPLENLRDYTIVECRLETGRTHQIRIHLSEAGHPLCGERTYLRLPGGNALRDDSGAPRQALHSADLALLHPLTEQPLHFRASLPPDLKTWLLKLRQEQRSP